MTQRWRRKAGAETYAMKDCPNHDGKVDIFDPQGFKYPTGCMSREQFERDYEPVPAHDGYGPDCARIENKLAESLESLKLADELASAVKDVVDKPVTSGWVVRALSAYLESRKEGK